MITGIHAMFYTHDAEGLRAFLRDKLGLAYTDVGEGWLIFDPPASEIGCHPSERGYHEISFFCDNLEATVAELEARGVQFTAPIKDEVWGRVTAFRLPDGQEVELYQPKYARRSTLD
jgi:catechol 2,3-dioxygenase-like lactoylglutathione lyase family enzyme